MYFLNDVFHTPPTSADLPEVIVPHDPQVLSELSAPRSTVLALRSGWTLLQSCELCVGYVLTAAVSEQVGELSML